MRGSEKFVLLVAIATPVLIALVGWPMFVNWVGGSAARASTPQSPGAAATSAAAGRGTQPTPRPTLGAPATVQPGGHGAPIPTVAPGDVAVAGVQTTPATATGPSDGAPAEPTAAAVAQPTARPVAAVAGRQPTPPPTAALAANTADPSEAVSSFYTLVAGHQFNTAAQLWSPHMLATFPPQQNINQRFSQTQSIRLQRAQVVSQDQSQATVAVDLVESTAPTTSQHYVGTWHLVRGAGGWMLDQPNLQTAP